MTLTEYIKSDMQRHIDAGQDLPCKLRIAALSDYYKVSLTPVRAAIEHLIEEGYLVKLSNGRLYIRELNRNRRRHKLAPIASKRPEEIEGIIRRDVIRASLQGSSDYLREAEASEKYAIGRTALRPILSRLAGQGFLNYVPRCGWKIRRLDEADLQAYLDCREALELKALEVARPRLERAELERLLEANRCGVVSKAPAFDNSLHAYWIMLSDNQYIQNFFSTYGQFYMTLLEALAPEAAVVEEVAQQHCEILEALIAKRGGEARRALTRHIRAQLPIARKAMEYLATRPSAEA